jgi:hypothetical protein
MIVLFEAPETWSLMMLVSAVAIDNADISEEAKDAIRRWRSDRNEASAELAGITDEINKVLNAHLDAKMLRRVKSKGWYQTAKA